MHFSRRNADNLVVKDPGEPSKANFTLISLLSNARGSIAADHGVKDKFCGKVGPFPPWNTISLHVGSTILILFLLSTSNRGCSQSLCPQSSFCGPEATSGTVQSLGAEITSSDARWK